MHFHGQLQRLRIAQEDSVDLCREHAGHHTSLHPLPFFNCCFHPSTRALLPSASASGTIPFF